MTLIAIFFLFTFTHALGADFNDVNFYWCNRYHRQDIICSKLESFNPRFFDGNIVFLIHGWTQNRSVSWYEGITEALLTFDHNVDVIQVDWSKPAGEEYRRSVVNTRRVGEIIAHFIWGIHLQNVSIKKIHLITYSLGAHVAGFIGKIIKHITSQKLGKITALDPSGPLFHNASLKHRLSETDAEIVVVIHTDGGQLGYLESCGTVDIYPNGGKRFQPGCENINGTEGDKIFCSHRIAPTYYIEAIQRRNFIATLCNDYKTFEEGFCRANKKIDIAGDIAAADAGKYYLKTNPVEPYGRGNQ